MGAAPIAFDPIGQMFFPGGYHPGFLMGQFQASKPDIEPHQGSRSSVEIVKAFWEANTYTDHSCKYIRKDQNASIGGFSAFTSFVPHTGERTLLPAITVRRYNYETVNDQEVATLVKPENVEAGLVHESIHLRGIVGIPPEKHIEALEWAEHVPEWKPGPGADVLFACLSNSASPIALSPRASLMIAPYMEADAFPKAAWIMALTGEENPAAMDALKGNALSVEEFLKIQEKSPDLKTALKEAALYSMAKSMWADPATQASRADWTFRDYYQDEMLNQFLADPNTREGHTWPDRYIWRDLRLNCNAKMEFVTLDLGDGGTPDAKSVLKIGNSFGPNHFETDGKIDPAFLNIPLKPEIERKLRRVEAILGIFDDSTLRTYNQAREAWGLTDQEYMDLAIKGGEPEKEFPFLQDRIGSAANLPDLKNYRKAAIPPWMMPQI